MNPNAIVPAAFIVRPEEMARHCDGKYYCSLYFDEERYSVVPDEMSNKRQPCLTVRSCASTIVDGRTGAVLSEPAQFRGRTK